MIFKKTAASLTTKDSDLITLRRGVVNGIFRVLQLILISHKVGAMIILH
jgi:hypothetical protein